LTKVESIKQLILILTAVTINNAPSLADEIAKLKKLFDEVTLTKDKYEAAKKKLIEKQ